MSLLEKEKDQNSVNEKRQWWVWLLGILVLGWGFKKNRSLPAGSVARAKNQTGRTSS